MRAATLITVLFFSLQAAAGPFSYSFKVLPKGEQCGESRCFSLDQFKLLIQYDSELNTLRAQAELKIEVVDSYKEMIKNLSAQVKLSLDSMTILQSEVRRISDKWVMTDKQLQECEASAPLWPWIIAGLGGVALVVAAVLIAVAAPHLGGK